MIDQATAFPSVVRKANQTFTEEFKCYVSKVQIEYQFTRDEMREYLAQFDVVVSDATLEKNGQIVL